MSTLKHRAVSLGMLVSLAVVLAGVVLTGCIPGMVVPSGPVKTETRTLGSFHGVSLECPGSLEIVPADAARLRVTANQNVLPYVSATVEGGVLVIELKRSGMPVQLAPGAKLEMVLETPGITTVEISGSGRISGGAFTGTQFTVTCSGSGEVDLDKVDVLSLTTDISGSGAVKIGGGVVGALQVDVSGSGSFEGPDMESRVVTARVSGSGSAEVWATEGLDASITGSGSVRYWGSPRLTEETTGSGSVKSLGPKAPSSGG